MGLPHAPLVRRAQSLLGRSLSARMPAIIPAPLIRPYWAAMMGGVRNKSRKREAPNPPRTISDILVGGIGGQ